jgi:hypothetical protein
MAVVSVKLSLLAEMEKKRMELFATHCVELASTESDQFAGNTALMDSVMMVPSAISLTHMDVELDTQFGMKTNVTVKILISAAKSGEPFGTLNAEQTSTMLLAVSVHQIALLVRPILVSHAQRTPMAVELAPLLSVHQALK